MSILVITSDHELNAINNKNSNDIFLLVNLVDWTFTNSVVSFIYWKINNTYLLFYKNYYS